MSTKFVKITLESGSTGEYTFTLSPTDFCVRYLLHIDSAPPGTEIYVNSQFVAHYNRRDALFELDITDFVFLDTNTLRFEVPNAGHVAAVSLVGVPCE